MSNIKGIFYSYIFNLLMMGAAGLAMGFVFTKPAYAGDLENQFTVSVWVRPEAGSTASQAIAVKDEEIRIVTNASSQPVCQIYASSVWQTGATSSTALSANVWQYVTCTYDKANIRIYVNGVQTGTQAQTVTANDASTKWRIGSDESTTYSDFNGTVDEIKIYDYARTTEQIISDMNAGHPAPGSPIGSALGHWKFDEGYGDTAYNSGSGGSTYDGSLGGSNTCPGHSTCPSWTNDGKFGKALTFNGNDSYVSTPLISNKTNDMGVSFWVNWSGTTGRDQTIFFNGNYDPADGWLVKLSEPDNDTLAIVCSNVNTATTNNVLTQGKWHHVYAQRNNSVWQLYFDGKAVALGGGTTCTPSTPTTRSVIGGNLLTQGFNGSIDEVQFFDFTLTQNQINLIYNQGKSAVFGAKSTDSSGLASFSDSRGYCVPGDNSYCDPPVAEWLFNEKQGGYAYDTSGNGNTGTLVNGPVWKPAASCVTGACLEFDGVNDSVELMNDGGALRFNTISIDAWIKASDNDGTIVYRGHNNGDYHNYRLALNNGYLRFTYTGEPWSENEYNSSSSYNWTDGWHHVAVTHTFGSSNSIRLYKDGSNISGSWTKGGGATPQDFNTIYLGYRGSLSPNRFTGIIDNTRIYNYARTPSQIAWDYSRGVSQWNLKFDQVSGITAYDSGPMSVNGTLQGDASFNITAGNCKFGYCVNLDGTDDYISTSNFSPLSGAGTSTTNASWGGWYYLTSSGVSRSLMEKANELRLTTDSNSRPVCDIYTGGSFTSNTASSTNPALSLSGWHNIICTYDGTNIRLYVNATLRDTWAQAGNITAASSAAYIGSSSGGTGDVSGRVDEQYIFNYPLTPQQIRNVYNNGAVRFGN